MNHHYKDIRDRIPELPKWFDENAVPRYGEFTPRDKANIYASEVVLMEIECQSCGQRFMVCVSSDEFSALQWGKTLADQIRDGTIHYGDPPNIQCCPAGPTMNCDDLRIVEYWHQVDYTEWQRDQFLEIALPDLAEIE